jgi:hypothetical protein
MNHSLNRTALLVAAVSGALLCAVAPLIPTIGSDAQALPAWSRKYQAECTMCHAPNYARLNYYGEKFLANGYQNANTAEPDGASEGKQSYGSALALDTNIGHWMSARLNLTPIGWESKALTVKGDTKDKITIGNANWLQLFVGGSITDNVSVYIENEFGESYHQAWYYMGFHNLGNTPWMNFQVGRLSPVVFAPYPDRLPQLPAIGGGILRIKSANGAGELGIDMRSPRYGLQYYGHQGPAILYGGVTPGAKPSNAGGDVGYWAGLRLYMPEGSAKTLEGSSVGVHFDGGTNSKDPATTKIEDKYTRVMPGVNIRWNDKLDIQGAFVMAKDDNWTLTETKNELKYDGFRAVGSYYVNNSWIVSMHFDKYKAKDDEDSSLLPEANFLYLPVTYLMRQNLRVTLYPGIDLRDVDSDLKRHTVFVNIRSAF